MKLHHFFYITLILVSPSLVVYGHSYGDFYDKKGNKIGSDGQPDGKKYIVTDRSDVKKIKRITKAGGYTREKDIPSSVVLPSDAAIRESLDVLKRTEANGGLTEQSSVVLKNDSVIRGAVGEKARVVNNLHIAECILPALPEGSTTDDVETTIHPHPTAIHTESGSLYPHTAIKPSKIDRATFASYITNIIVGPLEEIATFRPFPFYGPPKTLPRSMGIAVYYHNGTKPSVTITKFAAERILKKY